MTEQYERGYDFHEYANLFPMLDEIELGELTDDIRLRGLEEEIVLYEGKILDGRNRYLACREAKVKPRFGQYTGHDALGYVISMNLHRRHLNSSQRAVIALDALPKLEAKARERQQATHFGSLGGGNISTTEETGKARDEAAATFGTNPRYVSDAKKIAEEAPELLPQIREGEITIPKAKRVINERKREQKREHMKTVSFEESVQGHYSVVYADPPWQFSNSGLNGSAEHHYPTMPTDEIAALPVKDCLTDDAVLFLWSTNAHLPDALGVMAAWGFRYVTNFVWVKDRQTHGKIGFYLFGKHELLLIGVRGSLLPEEKLGSVIEAPRREHSQKPEQVYELIEEMYPGLGYLEMFARQRREGWSVFGNEV